MIKGQNVRHKRCGNLILKVISPADRNGGKVIVCEVFIPDRLMHLTVTDIPENFY